MVNVPEKALDVLDARGWCKNNFLNDGKVCIEGALQMAAGWEVVKYHEREYIVSRSSEAADLYVRACNTVGKVADDRLGIDTRGPSGERRWPRIINDMESTTVEDVKLVLKEAAVRWDEEVA